MDSTRGESSLKQKTANSLKWNTVDRLCSQVLYGVVGVVLANMLSPEDYGLVGALLVFQAFAIIFSDSGFGAALLQKKEAKEEDWSTVFWFNLGVSVAIYWILWFAAPLIADIFQGDRRLIPLSKVMFLTFVLNALSIVQINRLMKSLDVKMVAVSNLVSQIAGGALGIALAIAGYGVWALVWQSVALAGIKTGMLWLTGGWMPKYAPRLASLKSMWRIGMSVFSSSMLNTAFQTVYSFVIGAFYSLQSLGVYTQADKWSKMGSASLSQVLTSTFVPVLARFQDDGDAFRNRVRRVNRLVAFVAFPVLVGMAAVGTPLFHTLFGEKWDSAILLFQILSVRGVFVVLVSLYGNFMLAKGYGRSLFMIEVVKDMAIVVAILATIWYGDVGILVWGQLYASIVTWIIVMAMVSRKIEITVTDLLRDLLPFAGATVIMSAICMVTEKVTMPAWMMLTASVGAGAVVYVMIAAIARFPEMKEALAYLKKK